MPTQYNGKDVMTFYAGNVDSTGVGFGTYRVMDHDFNTVAKVGLQQPYMHDFHEFQMIGPHTAVFSSYHAIPFNFTDVEGATDEHKWVFENRVTEIDVDTDEVLFQWNSIDHIPVNDTKVKNALKNDGKESRQPFDYMHLNSITKDDEGNFLICCRNLWSLYYIDGDSGKVIWSLGMSDGGSDWELEEDAQFAYQHHARWVDPEAINQPKEDNVKYLSIFDNGMSGAATAVNLRDTSRGIIVKLDSSYGATSDKSKIGKVSLVQEFKPFDETEKSVSQGSMQLLSNGNVFIGWGSSPKVTEHTINGDIVFAATINDGDHVSYRAFKGPFNGRPQDVPALVSVYDENKDTTTCFFSWNGASEVKSWSLYGGSTKDEMEEIESDIPHNTFESNYEATGYFPYTKIKALAEDGTVINEGLCQTYFQKA
ncbi:hypothetical protein TRICI_006908 [Trichomonascus ciferrii]|uniref:ASST-domain-containing protein n=1 Tax=Trichomonascus ciferrii TaxID=44093 RepID=A0A642UBU8_9ASCO|nr:hypothetical protein TRICI_006908 [Trichomonascus ciferrii]